VQKRMKTLGNAGKRLAVLATVLGVTGCLVIPMSAGADTTLSSPGMSLVFAGGKAHNVADNVAVPVTCVGVGHGFCSGNVTLSHDGRHISIPFSVQSGSREVLFVPLALRAGAGHPRKVHGVATTVQPLGPATSTKEFLYAE
jgi:hypothetical protein